MTVANSAIAVLVLIGAVSVVYSVVWRLYFSPLAKFPGPKIAAATLLYEMYYEIVAGGQYTFKIRDMHEKYGAMNRNSGAPVVLVDKSKDQLYESTLGNSISTTQKSTIRSTRADQRRVTNGHTCVDNLEPASKLISH